MNILRLPLSELAKSPVLSIEIAADEASIRPDGATPLGLRDIAVSGVLSKIDTELFFQGSVRAALEAQCDRCLSRATRIVELEVDWYFEPGESAQEVKNPYREAAMEFHGDELEDIQGTTVRLYKGDEIDLAPIVWEELVFAVPSKFLCTDDCKGLCPECGANLNEIDCDCGDTTKTGHSELSKLKDMFPNLPDTTED